MHLLQKGEYIRWLKYKTVQQCRNYFQLSYFTCALSDSVWETVCRFYSKIHQSTVYESRYKKIS